MESEISIDLERPFKCLQCELTFERASQLDYHERNIHLGEKSQICQICGKCFFRKTDLKTHLNVHLGVNQLSCKICGRKFNHVSNLIRHSRSHEGMKPYPCSTCGKRFTQISSVVRHKRIHEKETNSDDLNDENNKSEINKSIKRRHYCKICGETFPFISLLRRHEKLHFLAETSDKAQSSPDNMEQILCLSSETPAAEKITFSNEKHESPTKSQSSKSFTKRLHIEGNQLFIEVCESDDLNHLGMSSQEMLENYHQHDDLISQEHNAPTFRLIPHDLGQQLYELEMNYLSKKYLDQSRTVNSLESIEVCQNYQNCELQISPNEENIDKKIQDFVQSSNSISENSESSTNNEENENESDNQSPKVRLVQNEEGEQFFELVRDPLDYVEPNKSINSQKIPENVDKESIIKKIDSKLEKKRKKINEKVKGQEQRYECSICRKKFSTASNLKQHAGTHFQDQQKFHCKECGISFAWKSTLNKHLASHHRPDGPQKFVCEICPKVYCTLSQVNEHVKRDHLKERNHLCEECGKSFFKKFDLKSHIRTHTKERPYICKICDKKFYHQSHIIRHERIHSGERPYSCGICKKTFAQLSSLKAHKQRHQSLTKIDILDYQNNEDDPMALSTISTS